MILLIRTAVDTWEILVVYYTIEYALVYQIQSSGSILRIAIPYLPARPIWCQSDILCIKNTRIPQNQSLWI
jgi:hypothetical protein